MLINPRKETSSMLPALAQTANALNKAQESLNAAIHNAADFTMEDELRLVRHNVIQDLSTIKRCVAKLDVAKLDEGTE